MIKRIAITGPECTGKSQLANQLADHYQTVCTTEYARAYLDTLGRKYEYKDLIIIAQKQFEQENRLARKANNFLFCDTEFGVLKIWSEDKFRKCDPWIENRFKNHIYDLYLLMDINIPWTIDPQREDPNRRQYLFDWYKRELNSLGVNWQIITGIGENRLKDAVNYITLLKTKGYSPNF